MKKILLSSSMTPRLSTAYTTRLAAALVLSLSSTLLNAQEFRALYACSSGGDSRPITYAFNSKFMLRDGASGVPFELIANYKDGELMYTGYVKGESFDFWDKVYGFTDDSMKKWSTSFERLIDVHDPVNTKHEYILRKALNCTIDGGSSLLSRNNSNLNYERIKKEDSSKVDLSHADSCEKSMMYASSVGISDIVAHFKSVNFQKIVRQEGAVRKSLVVINTKKGEVWESWIGSKAAPKVYKCTVISKQVPEITPPKEKMFSDSI